eukprot:1795856-Rhodomonas_salina.1
MRGGEEAGSNFKTRVCYHAVDGFQTVSFHLDGALVSLFRPSRVAPPRSGGDDASAAPATRTPRQSMAYAYVLRNSYAQERMSYAYLLRVGC